MYTIYKGANRIKSYYNPIGFIRENVNEYNSTPKHIRRAFIEKLHFKLDCKSRVFNGKRSDNLCLAILLRVTSKGVAEEVLNEVPLLDYDRRW